MVFEYSSLRIFIYVYFLPYFNLHIDKKYDVILIKLNQESITVLWNIKLHTR